jgi:hypothetical protein
VPIYSPSQDIGTGKARLESIDAPRGGAFDALGMEQAYRGGYEIKAAGVIAGSDLLTQYQSLRSYLGKREKLWRIDDSGNLTWAWARLESVGAKRVAENKSYLEVDCSFYVYSALWSGALHGSWRLDAGNALDDGLYFDTDLITALTVATTTLTINNGGNGVLRAFEFAITAKTSAITAVAIEKAGETHMTWTGTLAVNTQLVIDFGAMSILNSGVNAYSGLVFSTSHKIDDWMRLDPGNNTVTLTRTGGGATSEVALVYYDGWV